MMGRGDQGVAHGIAEATLQCSANSGWLDGTEVGVDKKVETTAPLTRAGNILSTSTLIRIG